MKLHSVHPFLCGIITISLLSGLLAFSGCSGSHQAATPPSSSTPPTPAAVKGTVRGGQVPVTGTAIQLYAVGTTGDGSSATPLLSQPLASDASGNFSLTGAYTCPSPSSLVYVTATGGNPGLVAGTNNTASLMIAALGPCGSVPASFIVNEVTTVAAIWPLASFMSSPSAIGSSTTDASNLSAAFVLAAEFADVTTGIAPGTSVPTGTTMPSDEINTLADILSACVNSAGGVAGDGSPCGQLFTLTTPAGGSAPTSIAVASHFIEQNPTQNIPQLFALLPTDAPFSPMLSIPPVDWSVHPSVPSALVVTPSSISFPPTIINFTAAAQTITLSNSGSTAIDLNGIALTGANAGDFTINNSCTSTLPSNQTCAIQVSFSPTVTGSKYAYLTITNSDTSQPVAIALTGKAVNGSGALSVSPTSLSFSQLSVPQTVTLANSSPSAIAIQSIALSNQNFTESNTCGTSIAANASCTLSVTATVANSDSATPLTATLTILAGDTIGVHTIPLSTSIAPIPGPLVVAPNSLTFTTAGVPQNVTLTNSGSAVLTLQSITLADPAFVQTNTCGSTLAPAATCTVSVTINALGVTPLTSALTILANDAAGTHTVALSAVASSGTLPPLTVTPSSTLAFPPTLLYFSSAVQTLTVTNTTPDAIYFSISFTGAATNNYLATFPDRCLSPLLGGQSCTVQVAFTPVTAGAHNGSLEFSLTSGAPPVIIPVTGTGVAGTGGAVTLSPSSLTFTQFGIPAPVTVTNTGTTAVAIGPISTSNYSETNNCGSSLDPQSVCTIEVSATGLSFSGSNDSTLTVIAGDATGTHSIPLYTPGYGVDVSVPGPIAFGSWAVGITSAPQLFYLAIRGGPDGSLEITGPDASAFSFDPGSSVLSSYTQGCEDGCSVPIYFTPSRLGPYTATLTTTFGNAMLTGTGNPAGPSFALSGNVNPIYQPYGSTSGNYSTPITVTNNGSTPLNLSETMTGANASQYVLTKDPCPATLAVASSCGLEVAFLPDHYGSLPADLKVTDNTSGINQTLTFMGFGTYPGPSASPNQIIFSDTQIGSVSGPITTTVTATENHPVTVFLLSKNSEFGVTTTSCSATPCQIGVTFAPTVTGVVSDSVIVHDIVTGTSGPIYVRGSGGVPAVSLSSSMLSFASRNTGSNSIAQTVTLTNSGNGPLNISTISISGANAADFTQINTCFNSPIDAGATCTLSISFSPTEVGNLSAAVQILSDAPPASIDLTGAATSPSP